jgi:putative hydrolase of the HAD superfamily
MVSRVTNQLLAILFDFGDTLDDQGTEVKDDTLTTLGAELIPGTAELLHELKRRGYRLAIVSNGPVDSIPNVLGHHGVYDLFEVSAISQGLGVDKPDPRIFRYALDYLGISEKDFGRTIMVGNDLSADIAGANGLGMIRVWLNWSPRDRKTPAGELEAPRYTIDEPLALLPLIEELEQRQSVREAIR